MFDINIANNSGSSGINQKHLLSFLYFVYSFFHNNRIQLKYKCEYAIEYFKN